MRLTRKTVVDVLFTYVALGPYAGVLVMAFSFVIGHGELAGLLILIHPGMVALAYTAGLVPAITTGGLMLGVLWRAHAVGYAFVLHSIAAGALTAAAFALVAREGEGNTLAFGGIGALAGLLCGLVLYLRLRPRLGTRDGRSTGA